MYSLPISETEAIAIDDADEDAWMVHVVDFANRSIDSFAVEGIGHIESLHYDVARGLIWVIVDGTIFAIQRSEQQIFEVPPPPSPFYVYAMTGEGPHVYVGGEYSNLWRIALPALEWEALQTPAPPPPETDDEAEQSRRNKAYARAYPPYYHGFPVGDAYVFCGALGALARVRGRTIERQSIETEPRLMTGRTEGAQLSLSSDSPMGEIYLGDFDQGFEVIFADTLRALHRTALHGGRRYIGVAEYPSSSVENLYLRDGDLLDPVDTGCPRNPYTLISLSTVGRALWAIDAGGIFRLAEGDGGWKLVDIDDVRRGIWPEGA